MKDTLEAAHRRFEVSECGRLIVNRITGKPKRLYRQREGDEPALRFYLGKKQKKLRVASLVMRQRGSYDPEAFALVHVDGDRDNNRITNLLLQPKPTNRERGIQ
ncbi:HNH endonuclease [Mariniblastus sp.]|nr:HNH endonuclease [Mariniblastus sp.]